MLGARFASTLAVLAKCIARNGDGAGGEVVVGEGDCGGGNAITWRQARLPPHMGDDLMFQMYREAGGEKQAERDLMGVNMNHTVGTGQYLGMRWVEGRERWGGLRGCRRESQSMQQ